MMYLVITFWLLMKLGAIVVVVVSLGFMVHAVIESFWPRTTYETSDDLQRRRREEEKEDIGRTY